MHDSFRTTAKIVGLGAYLPERVLTNRDLEAMVDTSDEWIRTRTGIRERRVVAEGEALVDLVTRAGRAALADAGVDPREVDLLILATATVEQPIPATAAIVQPALGVVNAACFDVSAACSGFTYSLNVGRQFIATGEAKTVLVIGAECLTRYLDWTDRTTCVLFGDGAGAAVLRPGAPGEGILQIRWRTDGSYADLISMPGGGCRYPPSSLASIEAGLPFIKMRGNETFKVAVRSLTEISLEVMEAAGIAAADLDLFIPHQANLRIIQAVGKRLELTDDQVFVNVDRVGNTSAASIPVAMTQARDEGRLGPGSLVLASAFGGGLTWASSLIRF
ncbi:MAG: ketoacyl-ACP synthase III [Thermoanaerobaculales bacterium]|jgi:3-oxoacyl-[acyl-carrier-protein] synthase-3|nr:ketoacyl-ACP synthase III [Thermoanaerobaculales bacterium]